MCLLRSGQGGRTRDRAGRNPSSKNPKCRNLVSRPSPKNRRSLSLRNLYSNELQTRTSSRLRMSGNKWGSSSQKALPLKRKTYLRRLAHLSRWACRALLCLTQSPLLRSSAIRSYARKNKKQQSLTLIKLMKYPSRRSQRPTPSHGKNAKSKSLL